MGSFIQRKFIAKLRLGCLELRIETGRYSRPRLPAEARICTACRNQNKSHENEDHFLFICDTYKMERKSWLENLIIPDNFSILPLENRFDLVLNDSNNVKRTAQY